MELTATLFVVVIIAAILCQYMSVSFGVGYGTPLTPLLLTIGFAPLQIIPAVLLSQLVGGIVGGLAHQRAGNIELDYKQDDGRELKGDHHEHSLLTTVNLDCEIERPQEVFFAISENLR